MVCFKLHNFIIDTGYDNDLDTEHRIPVHSSNLLQGEDRVFLQTELHREDVPETSPDDNDKFRAHLAINLNQMGYTRRNIPS